MGGSGGSSFLVILVLVSCTKSFTWLMSTLWLLRTILVHTMELQIIKISLDHDWVFFSGSLKPPVASTAIALVLVDCICLVTIRFPADFFLINVVLYFWICSVFIYNLKIVYWFGLVRYGPWPIQNLLL